LLQEWGFTRLKTDSCLFVNSSKDLWVLVWVDDLLIASTSSSAIANFKKGIETRLRCKDLGVLEAGGAAKSFTGRVFAHHGTRITMALPSGYVDDILRSMEMTSCKPLSSTGTSSGSDKELEFPEDWDENAELQKYRQVVGKLQWLVTARPDIAFSVKTLARETSGVTPDSWRKVKHLLRYLQGG